MIKQLKDGTILINGFAQGIADSPYDGISDLRNVNIISIPGEASVNFSTQKASATNYAGLLTTTSDAGDTATLAGYGALEVGQAIFFTSLSNAGAGLANSTPYWIITNSSGVVTLSATWGGSSPTPISANSITGNWQTYNMAQPNYFAFDKLNTSYYMVDSLGQVWSNAKFTASKYWTYTGNFGGTNGGQTGRGLGYYQGSDGTGWIFVFRDAAIDYMPTTGSPPSGAQFVWLYGWKPSDGSITNANGSCGLKTPANPVPVNSHETFVAPDNRFYFCDANYIGRWYQTAVPATGGHPAFDPRDTTSYTYDESPLLPFTDTCNCLAYLGSNLLIGGIKSIVYPWDRSSSNAGQPILIAESVVSKMLTVNTNTFILVGNRGRVYVTNGSNAGLYKKIPDHISGTIEPYFTWGGIGSTKNQLYISALATTNALSQTNNYGGLWAIDMDTKAIRLTNKLSYASYAGSVTAMIPIIAPPGTANPGGTGIYMGWSTGAVAGSGDRTVSTGVLNSSTTVTSSTIAFTAGDLGCTIAGTGIPTGTVISSVSSATTAIMSQTATASASGVSITITSGFGIDGTANPSTGVSVPYTGGEATIDSDYIPIGTYLIPKTNATVEFKLSVALVSGESIKLQWRQLFAGTDTYTDCDSTVTFTGSNANTYSGVYQNVNFQNSQWIQLRAVLTSTASSPSYVRLKEIRIK